MMTKVGDLLQRPAALPFPSAFAGYRTMTLNTDKAFDCDDFNGLGVTFIKGAGTNTAISASLHLPEVIKGINYAVTLFRNQEYLQDQIGEQIAELLEYEAVMASTFKFSAITLKKSRCGDSERLSIFRPTSPLLKQLLAMTEARYEMAIPSLEPIGNDQTMDISSWMMIPAKERIIAKRLWRFYKWRPPSIILNNKRICDSVPPIDTIINQK